MMGMKAKPSSFAAAAKAATTTLAETVDEEFTNYVAPWRPRSAGCQQANRFLKVLADDFPIGLKPLPAADGDRS